MAVKIILLSIVLALIYSQAAGQFWGGIQPLPFGSYSETAGFRGGPLWGSVQQNRNSLGFTSPIIYSGGANLLNANKHGFSGSFNLQSGTGGLGTLRGDFPILNNPIHNINGFGQIDRALDKNFNLIGPERNSFGATYKNTKNLATASFTQTQTHGQPAIKTISGSLPVLNTDSHMLTLSGQTILNKQDRLGVNYQNKNNGASASLTGTKNAGSPIQGTAAVSIPLVNKKDIQVNVQGQSTFGHGMKPDHQLGVNVNIPLPIPG